MAKKIRSKGRLLAAAVVIVLVGYLTIVFFRGLGGVDVYAGKRPGNYGTANWICEDPEIVLHVNPDRSIRLELPGYSGEEELKFNFDFGRGCEIWVKDESGAMITLFRGTCRFGSEKMSVVVTQDDLFGGQYRGKKIVFYRTALQDSMQKN